MAGQLEAFHRGDFCPVHFQDREILIKVITDIEIFSVRRESRTFGQAADLDIADFGHLLAGDAQHRNAAITLVKVSTLVVGACEDDRHCDIALG